jgi:hypothetical protein
MGQYDNLIAQKAQRYGIPVRLGRAVVGQESGGSRTAVSSKGATGVMQLMPDTARGLGLRVGNGVDDRLDPEKNIDAGMRYLRQQYDKFGRWDLALAAYNAGPGAVQKYGGVPPFKETQTYVRNISAAAGLNDANFGANQPAGGRAMATTTRTTTSTGGGSTASTARWQSLREQYAKDYEKAQADLDAAEKAAGDTSNPEAMIAAKQKLAGLRSRVNAARSQLNRAETAIANAEGKGASGDKTSTTTSESDRIQTVTGADGQVYGIDPTTGKPYNLGLGSRADTPQTANELDDNARGWANVEIARQNAATALMREQISQGTLDFNQAKDFLDRVDKMPPAVNVGGKWYLAGMEPGGIAATLSKKHGFGFTPQEANVIDIAGALGRSDLNQHVLAGPYQQQLNQYGVKTGADAAGIASDKAAGAVQGANVPGTEQAQLNAVNPDPGEASTVPQEPVPTFGPMAGEPGGPTQAQVQANEQPPRMPPPPIPPTASAPVPEPPMSGFYPQGVARTPTFGNPAAPVEETPTMRVYTSNGLPPGATEPFPSAPAPTPEQRAAIGAAGPIGGPVFGNPGLQSAVSRIKALDPNVDDETAIREAQRYLALTGAGG